MSSQKISPDQVWQAIDIYLQHAYPAAPPSAVRGRLETLRSVPPDEFFASPTFERDKADPPSKVSLRLGNRFYPHMKLALVRSPDGHSFLFQADTHDRHCRPAPESREYNAFCELMEANQKLASSIEAAWAEAHLPTFKTYLRDDLERRKHPGHPPDVHSTAPHHPM